MLDIGKAVKWMIMNCCVNVVSASFHQFPVNNCNNKLLRPPARKKPNSSKLCKQFDRVNIAMGQILSISQWVKYYQYHKALENIPTARISLLSPMPKCQYSC